MEDLLLGNVTKIQTTELNRVNNCSRKTQISEVLRFFSRSSTMHVPFHAVIYILGSTSFPGSLFSASGGGRGGTG